MNVKALKQVLDEKGVSKEELANILGVDRATIYRRFAKNGESFTIAEANVIKDTLGLSKEEANSIFFTKKVA